MNSSIAPDGMLVVSSVRIDYILAFFEKDCQAPTDLKSAKFSACCLIFFLPITLIFCIHKGMKSTILFSSEDIQKTVKSLANTIASEYKGKKLVLVGVLDGSFIFMADLSRAIFKAGLTDFEITFVGISSYGNNTKTSGNFKITKELTTSITNKHVLLVEDVIDTGLTLEFLISRIQRQSPALLKICTLLSKTARRKVLVPIDFVGFEIKEDVWIEGYGLDTKHEGRANPHIVKVEF